MRKSVRAVMALRKQIVNGRFSFGDRARWRGGHADLFAFDRIAQRRLFAEDRAEDKIADQRVELGRTRGPESRWPR